MDCCFTFPLFCRGLPTQLGHQLMLPRVARLLNQSQLAMLCRQTYPASKAWPPAEVGESDILRPLGSWRRATRQRQRPLTATAAAAAGRDARAERYAGALRLACWRLRLYLKCWSTMQLCLNVAPCTPVQPSAGGRRMSQGPQRPPRRCQASAARARRQQPQWSLPCSPAGAGCSGCSPCSSSKLWACPLRIASHSSHNCSEVGGRRCCGVWLHCHTTKGAEASLDLRRGAELLDTCYAAA